MRTIFRNEENERFFINNGYIVFDLLTEPAVEDIWSFYHEEFKSGREVYPFARSLPYYISIFDQDIDHKKRVDALVSAHVRGKIETLMFDYEIFYSNLMIKFPGDGQIEAHQDFNFVDESKHTAFNLWCPLVDTRRQNGGLFVIPGSHNLFRTQRGPNIPKALTQYNDMLQRYATMIPLRKGQAIIFDHKLVHYSPPNQTDTIRVAIQSVLKPKEAPALHYIFDEPANRVRACQIDRKYILENNLWEKDINTLAEDHSEALIPFPDESEVIDALVKLRLHHLGNPLLSSSSRPMFKEDTIQKSFTQNGYVKLSLLEMEDVQRLTEIFEDLIGDDVKNTDYGMYISLEEEDLTLKTSIIEKVSAVILPRIREHFIDCRPNLGSFLVKVPGTNSYTYPHQDWTFVDSPRYCSVTVWIALVDTDENNGALGFINGSQYLFDQPIGSPSPYFQTFTQGHEDILYEYLEFVPLKAGEAVAFDNRTIHGAPPNLTNAKRSAVAIGMIPEEATLYHHYLLPGDDPGQHRRIAKFKVDQQFFHRYSLGSLKKLFENGESPRQYEIETIIEEPFRPFTHQEIEKLCVLLNLRKNGRKLVISQPSVKRRFPTAVSCVQMARSLATRVWGNVSRLKA
jgi:ectoine hydroxylase-related dioxygenase (phytanoyl-CoA dioxygenase family)